jgi:hypothetical protein
MKKLQRVALVGAGKFTDSPLGDLRGLRDRLGPVKASSLRLASRIVNTLRAGHAVSDFEQFKDCQMVLISVPDAALGSTLAELAAAPIHWKRTIAILYSSALGACDLAPLASLGAHACSLTELPGFESNWFALECERSSETALRPLFAQPGTRLLTIPPGRKPLLVGALACTGPLLLPVFMAASEALKDAGVPSSEAALLVERQVMRYVRGHFKSGRKACPTPSELPRLIEQVLALGQEMARPVHDEPRRAPVVELPRRKML